MLLSPAFRQVAGSLPTLDECAVRIARRGDPHVESLRHACLSFRNRAEQDVRVRNRIHDISDRILQYWRDNHAGRIKEIRAAYYVNR